MPALAAADVTLTVDPLDFAIVGRRRRGVVKIAFGDGALTYPASGVPLPAIGNFGMVRNLEALIPFDPNDASGIIWKYDKDNHKLRGWRQNIRTGSTAAADSTSGARVEDTAGAETVFRAMGTAIDTDYDTGALAELLTTFAPPAQTIYCEVSGW